jgi:hypothetical protein
MFCCRYVSDISIYATGLRTDTELPTHCVSDAVVPDAVTTHVKPEI